MKAITALLSVAFLLYLGGSAHAQDVPGRRTRAQQDSVAKQWLRTLDINQQKYFAEHGTYTTDLPALGMNGKPQDVQVTVVLAGGRSWWGLASFGRAKCVIWVGKLADFPSPPTTARVRATKEREPACDAP